MAKKNPLPHGSVSIGTVPHGSDRVRSPECPFPPIRTESLPCLYGRPAQHVVLLITGVRVCVAAIISRVHVVYVL